MSNLNQIMSEKRFNSIMQMSIEELNLSRRALNCLYYYDYGHNPITTIEKLIKLTEADLHKIRGLGKNIFKEIVQRIKTYELDLRPEDIDTEEWVKELKLRLCTVKLNNKKDLDINEIPEKYRKTYAIGAGVVAKQELKKNSIVGVSKKVPTKSNVVADKPALPKVKISKQSINEMSDKQLLKVIAEDISIIESLEESFITKYRKDLIKIILANSTLDVDKRLELVELINNTQINTL